jgi:hypothetical protein
MPAVEPPAMQRSPQGHIRCTPARFHRGDVLAVNRRPLALVIDDSDDTRDMYAAVLHLEGFTVEEARDGQEGALQGC